MKKTMISALSILTALCMAGTAYAGAFDTYNDYQKEDGTFCYYFDHGQGVFVTMDEEWYQNTRVVSEEGGATFYHKASYEAWQKEGQKGGRLFTLGASVNTSFSDLPHFIYIGFDEEDAMNYYADLPTDYQAYPDGGEIEEEYKKLYAGVEDVVAGIQIGTNASQDNTETGVEAEKDNAENTDSTEGKAGISIDPDFSITTSDGSIIGTDEQTESAPDGAWVGGWAAVQDDTITDELKEMFNDAVAPVEDVYFVPVVLLSTQVVAGTNYCFLAREFSYEDPNEYPSYVLVYIYKDLQGNVQLLDFQDLKIGI